MPFKEKKSFIFSIFTFCLLSIFPINTFAQSFIDEASNYTVRFRVLVDHPFVEDTDEDDVVKSWVGAGFVVDKSLGLIVTNAHVSGVANTYIKIAFKGERFIKSELVYVDPELDIALVKIKPEQMPKNVKEGELSCDKTIKNGTAVAAYGHPKGLKFSASRGIISNQRFLYGKEVIQTDAAINSGNSGGPLINLENGLIVGINKSTVKKSSGIGLAVPSYLLCKILDLYKKGKSPLPMEIPIKFAKDNETEQYNKVSELHLDGKILEIGSSLVKVNDTPIKTPADLKGKKVGFSVGGVEEAILDSILRHHGAQLEDVELVNVNFSLSPSLMSRQVDAVIGAYRNFELNQMDIEGVKGNCFFVEEEGLPSYDELIYVANSNTMDTDMIRRFLAATEKATQYIVNHPQKSWEIFSGTSAELQDELNERAWADTLPRFALRPTAMDEGRYAAFEAFLNEAGLIPSQNPVSKIAIDVTAR